MLNFAEQTGSGAVMLVWSFPSKSSHCCYIYCTVLYRNKDKDKDKDKDKFSENNKNNKSKTAIYNTETSQNKTNSTV